jgi:RNA polymerase sigma-70 factor (ECF subfamily)
MIRRSADPSPIEPLFRAHFDAIHRFAACRVGPDAALDVAAETFAQALRSAARIDPERDARAWLFGVAANVLRHHRRAEMRRIRAYARAVDRGRLREGGDGDDGAARERLVEALEGLDARDRETLLLFAWADLSYEQIAIALGVPVGTVRSRIHRARRSLRAVLADPVGASEGPESGAITAAREA